MTRAPCKACGQKPRARNSSLCHGCHSAYASRMRAHRAEDGEPLRYVCECGRRKETGAEGCQRCMDLDGGRYGDAVVIGTLRLLGGSGTLEQLATAGECTDRNILRYMSGLVRAGRVRRVVLDGRESLFALAGRQENRT